MTFLLDNVDLGLVRRHEYLKCFATQTLVDRLVSDMSIGVVDEDNDDKFRCSSMRSLSVNDHSPTATTSHVPPTVVTSSSVPPLPDQPQPVPVQPVPFQPVPVQHALKKNDESSQVPQVPQVTPHVKKLFRKRHQLEHVVFDESGGGETQATSDSKRSRTPVDA